MNKKFCDKCLKEVNCEYKEVVVTEILSGKQVKYLKKYYTCLECGNDFYDDLIDYNIEAANTQLRKINNIITIIAIFLLFIFFPQTIFINNIILRIINKTVIDDIDISNKIKNI